VRNLFSMLGRKFNGFAEERFNTVLPIFCGSYAVRVRLRPVGNPPPSSRSKGVVEAPRERLASGPLHWDLELQLFGDEATTPIEDASKAWPEADPRSSPWCGSPCPRRAATPPPPRPCERARWRTMKVKRAGAPD
jgi:hypothetical protein